MRGHIAAGLAGLCIVVIVAIHSADTRNNADILNETELFIVPEANVLTGIGQIGSVKEVEPRVKRATASTSGKIAGPVIKKVKSKTFEADMHWSHAMLEVQKRVMKQILKQRKQRETAAAKRAEASYSNKLSSSLSLENRRMRQLASQEKQARAHDHLQVIEDAQDARTHRAHMQQSVQAKLSEFSSERISEQAGGAKTLHHYAVVGSQGLHHLGNSGGSVDSASTPTWLRTDV